MKKIVTSVAPALAVLAVATFVFAQADIVPAPGASITTVVQLLVVINKAIDLIFTVLIVFSVIFIITAAFQFVTGGGDPAQVLAARQKLIWAAVGIIVALLARAIPTVIRTVLNVPA